MSLTPDFAGQIAPINLEKTNVKKKPKAETLSTMRCSCWEWLLLEQVVLQCMRWESHTWMKMSKIRWRQCTLAYLWQVGFLVSYHHTGNWWYTSFLQRRNWNNHFSIIGYSFFSQALLSDLCWSPGFLWCSLNLVFRPRWPYRINVGWGTGG